MRFQAHLLVSGLEEYRTGKTREGDELVKGFYCDLMVLSPETWRHMNEVAMLVPFVRKGLEAYTGPQGGPFSLHFSLS